VSKDRRFVPSSETTPAPSDVLSESTDLNALLTALLGEGSTAPSPQSSDAEVVGDFVQPTSDDASGVGANAPPIPSLPPSRDQVLSPAPAPINWVTAFPSERSDPAVDSLREFRTSHRTLVSERKINSPANATPVVAAIVQPPRTVLQQRRGFLSRAWPFVAIGLVAMLVTLSAISKRSGTDATPTPPDIAGALERPLLSSAPVSPATTTSASGPVSSAATQVPAIPRTAPQAATTVKGRAVRPERRVRTLPPQRPADSANVSRNDPQNPASATIATESEMQSARSVPTSSTTASPPDVARVPEQSSAAEARLPNSTTPEATPDANVAAASQTQLPAPSAPRVSAPASTATSSAAAPRPTAPRLLAGGVPEYANALRAARVGGTVEVRVTIDATGRVTKAESMSGPGPLREAAERAVRQWRYEPATLNGAPIAAETTVSFTFNPNRPSRPQ
jgi:periplasmic protein TonB